MDGPALRRERKSLKLTQSAFADLLGVSANTVARWERGEASPPGIILDLAIMSLRRAIQLPP